VTDYDVDVFLWSQEQADALKWGDTINLDWPHLAEEIESVGISQKRELRSRLKLLYHHLLKWAYQPERRSSSWQITINNQRDELIDLLTDSPSLRSYLIEQTTKAYARGRHDALIEMGLLQLPTTVPWSLEQILDREFLPEDS
jgi:hypothetical protein